MGCGEYLRLRLRLWLWVIQGKDVLECLNEPFHGMNENMTAGVVGENVQRLEQALVPTIHSLVSSFVVLSIVTTQRRTYIIHSA